MGRNGYRRTTVAAGLCALVGLAAFGQNAEAPKFEIADVHVAPKVKDSIAQPFSRVVPLKNGRWEIHNATMVDLIRMAYDFDADKILGGPNWLEMDRFEVIAKTPADANAETAKPMLQTLLGERFRLKVHKETQQLPTYALSAGKKPSLKASDGSGDTGCKPVTSSNPSEGGMRIMMASASAPIVLGPNMEITYQCRNMTMEAFTSGLRGMLGANLGTNPILDRTGMDGKWNFDLRWSLSLGGLPGEPGDRISLPEAVDKQLGLKLEQVKVPTPVLVVDSADQKPAANPPGIDAALPAPVAPKEFEVADIKPTDPSFQGGRMQMMPGGRMNSQGMPFNFLIGQAFGVRLGISSEMLVGVPKWAESTRFDIVAKAPAGVNQLDQDTAAVMIRALLVDRFKMKYHTEERPVSAYSLVSSKPKLKKADPANRATCKSPNPPPGTPPGTQLFVCQNVTMAQFAEQLGPRIPNQSLPLQDSTGLEGTWDITLTWNPRAGQPNLGGRGPVSAESADSPAASDPSGGYTIFEAVEKELGLKLEPQKRPAQVYVIDHLEEKPTDN